GSFLAATLDRSVRACVRSGVVQPERLVSSGVGRSAVPTFRRATIADGDGVRHVSSTDKPSRAFFAVDSDRASCRPDATKLRERPRSARVAAALWDLDQGLLAFAVTISVLAAAAAWMLQVAK
ncbi:MAG TPA: hypothetical protein VMK12_14460, partial [Anaeromyxobacteraceae bacterium]|nr:hypothetical protein [Anaeromyxobacteraceae bacterium]